MQDELRPIINICYSASDQKNRSTRKEIFEQTAKTTMNTERNQHDESETRKSKYVGMNQELPLRHQGFYGLIAT